MSKKTSQTCLSIPLPLLLSHTQKPAQPQSHMRQVRGQPLKPPVTKTKYKVSKVSSLSGNQQPPWLSLPGTESGEGSRDTWDDATFAGSVYLCESDSLVCGIQKPSKHHDAINCWCGYQNFKLGPSPTVFSLMAETNNNSTGNLKKIIKQFCSFVCMCICVCVCV